VQTPTQREGIQQQQQQKSISVPGLSPEQPVPAGGNVVPILVSTIPYSEHAHNGKDSGTWH